MTMEAKGKLESPSKTSPLTIGEHLTYILPRLGTDRKIPAWPADVFALCTSLLQKSGSYIHALNQWPPVPPNGKPPDSRAWTTSARGIGDDWRLAWISRGGVPPHVEELWLQLVNAWEKPIREFLRGSDKCALSAVVLELAVLADTASVGVGVAGFTGKSGEQEFYKSGRPSPAVGFEWVLALWRDRQEQSSGAAENAYPAEWPYDSLSVHALSALLR